GDTDAVPRGTGTYASKSLQIGGVAVERAAVEVVELARQRAAEELEANPDDIVLEGGLFHVAGAPSTALGWADLGELRAEVDFEEDGNPLHTTLLSYCFPSASEVPFYELVASVTPTPVNPLGAKGLGESGTIGATPAVQNAVIDALAPYGIRHVDMPANGER